MNKIYNKLLDNGEFITAQKIKGIYFKKNDSDYNYKLRNLASALDVMSLLTYICQWNEYSR
jgi:hypothetical protein